MEREITMSNFTMDKFGNVTMNDSVFTRKPELIQIMGSSKWHLPPFGNCGICGEGMDEDDVAEMFDEGESMFCHPECGLTNGLAIA